MLLNTAELCDCDCLYHQKGLAQAYNATQSLKLDAVTQWRLGAKPMLEPIPFVSVTWDMTECLGAIGLSGLLDERRPLAAAELVPNLYACSAGCSAGCSNERLNTCGLWRSSL